MVTLKYTGDYTNNSVWIQTGDTWGSGIALSGALNTDGATTTGTVPAGDYWVYCAGPGYRSNDHTYVYKGSTISMSLVTNGSSSAWKSNSKISISADATITVHVESD